MADKTLGLPRATGHLEVASQSYRWSALSPRLSQPLWSLCWALVTWRGAGQLWVMSTPDVHVNATSAGVQPPCPTSVKVMSSLCLPWEIFRGGVVKPIPFVGSESHTAWQSFKKNNNKKIKECLPEEQTHHEGMDLSQLGARHRLWSLRATAKTWLAWKSGQETLQWHLLHLGGNDCV